jgi:hypothetical protein
MMDFRLLRKRMSRRTLLCVSLVGSIASLGAISGVASSGADVSRQAHGSSVATAARVVALHLTTNLHLVGRPGHVAYAKGTVSGTFSGTTSVRYTAIGSTGGEATFTMYPSSGGSMTGRSVTHGHAVGPTAYFTGTATITGGTGRWAHAHGTGLSFSGSLDRQNYHSTSVTSGNIRV